MKRLIDYDGRDDDKLGYTEPTAAHDEPESEGSGDHMGGLSAETPRWLRAAITLGVPSVIALFLVYGLQQRLDTGVQGIAKSLDAHVQQMATEDARQATREQRLLFIMRQVCVNTATSEAQRELCRIQ